MSGDIHRTVAKWNPIPGQEGWEFSCPHCNYHARYISNLGQGQKLVILDHGDSSVRHLGELPPNWQLARPMNVIERSAPEDKDLAYEEEVTLPIELERQVEEILQRMGFSG